MAAVNTLARRVFGKFPILPVAQRINPETLNNIKAAIADGAFNNDGKLTSDLVRQEAIDRKASLVGVQDYFDSYEAILKEEESLQNRKLVEDSASLHPALRLSQDDTLLDVKEPNFEAWRKVHKDPHFVDEQERKYWQNQIAQAKISSNPKLPALYYELEHGLDILESHMREQLVGFSEVVERVTQIKDEVAILLRGMHEWTVDEVLAREPEIAARIAEDWEKGRFEVVDDLSDRGEMEDFSELLPAEVRDFPASGKFYEDDWDPLGKDGLWHPPEMEKVHEEAEARKQAVLDKFANMSEDEFTQRARSVLEKEGHANALPKDTGDGSRVFIQK